MKGRDIVAGGLYAFADHKHQRPALAIVLDAEGRYEESGWNNPRTVRQLPRPPRNGVPRVLVALRVVLQPRKDGPGGTRVPDGPPIVQWFPRAAMARELLRPWVEQEVINAEAERNAAEVHERLVASQAARQQVEEARMAEARRRDAVRRERDSRNAEHFHTTIKPMIEKLGIDVVWYQGSTYAQVELGELERLLTMAKGAGT